MYQSTIPKKAYTILRVIALLFIIIGCRVLYLTSVKYDETLKKTLLQQQHTIIKSPERGIITDRFNIPLASNKIQYNAAVRYDQIKQIPRIKTISNKQNKITTYPRLNYIEKLSQLLGDYLNMNPIAIEDLIHSTVSSFPNEPFIIKEDLSESLYYQLRILEKDWPGLSMQRNAKRIYPQGTVAANILGYMGPITRPQYLSIIKDIHTLSNFIEERAQGIPIPLPKGFTNYQDVVARLNHLRKKSYTLHTRVGKSGIERTFEKSLRGLCGETHLEIGAKKKCLGVINQSPSIPGHSLTLTLSAELQAYAEQLLAISEEDRDAHFKLAGHQHALVPSPWIKGGSIVAMIPSTGEILAMASSPGFNPNDFHLTGDSKHTRIPYLLKWLENPEYLGLIWDGIKPLEKTGATINKEQWLSWDFYLDTILSKTSCVKRSLKRIASISHAIQIQAFIKDIQTFNGYLSIQETIDHIYSSAPIRAHDKDYQFLDHILNDIPSNKDKLLLLDLLRLIANIDHFPPEKWDLMKTLPLHKGLSISQSITFIKKETKTIVQQLYNEKVFPLWRSLHFKDFLKEKRKEEKRAKSYSHPYTKYLKKAKRSLFEDFWNTHELEFYNTIVNQSCTNLSNDLHPFLFHLIRKSTDASGPFLKHLTSIRKLKIPIQLFPCFCSFSTLSDPLWGKYRSLSTHSLQGLAQAFYPRYGFGYTRSSAYQDAAPIGSVFKLVTGYEALQHIDKRALSPLEIIDATEPNHNTKNGIVLGYHLDGSPITRRYKGGRLPKTSASLGRIDFVSAIERSSNIYFSLLAGDIINHPGDLHHTAKTFGFGKSTGIDLLGEFRGHVPDDIRYNKTGLYSFAIGQHSLTATPLQVTRMLCTIGNYGKILKPQLIKTTHTPYGSIETQPYIQNTIDMPSHIRTPLIEGMHRVVNGKKGPAQPHRIRSLYQHPDWMHEYQSMHNHFIGKTSTAEIIYRPCLDQESRPIICKNIWFAALSFKESDSYLKDIPDLCVVVYLKFGDYGKEAAPIAAKIIKKWKDIQAKHTSQHSHLQ